MNNKGKYEVERDARRPIYQKMIDILLADPLGWEMMCRKVRAGDNFDPKLPQAISTEERGEHLDELVKISQEEGLYDTSTESWKEELYRKFRDSFPSSEIQERYRMEFLTNFIENLLEQETHNAQKQAVERERKKLFADVLYLIAQHDPQTGYEVNPNYWGQTLRKAIIELSIHSPTNEERNV